MNYLSVCSGIEAASVAWKSLGWNPVAFSEIDLFPSAVLAHHWPNVPNMGNMTKYNEWKLTKRIDLLVGGTPCQAFSVAGLKQGLKDPRGNLTLTFLAMAEKFNPKWIVWENVPGVFSDKTNAFGQFLSGLGELGYEYAYRVLDAQNFGVAQRRRRVFVVAHLGKGGCAAKILFEPESLQGDIAESREERKVASSRSDESTTPTIIDRASFNQGINAQYEPKIEEGETMETLVARGPHAVGVTVMGSDQANAEITHEHTPALTCNKGSVPIAFGIKATAIGREPENGGNGLGVSREVSDTLTTVDRHAVAKGMVVRRLTPRECERLQGFPDDHTLIPWRGKDASQCPDGPRYKACGNSMAVPVMRWIGERIQMVERGIIK